MQTHAKSRASLAAIDSASARVLTNCGFQYLGDAEGHCVARDAVLPTWTYSFRPGGDKAD